MTDQPLISIITATYNRSSVLRYTIQSVLRQTYQNFEMIIVGDACTDDTEQVIATFNDQRLRWHNLSENSGSQGLPNNTGMQLAKGTYIALLNHDDLWHPMHLELMFKHIQETNADMVHSLSIVTANKNDPYRRLVGFSQFGNYERGMYIPSSSWMHTRALIDDIGGWKDYRTIRYQPDMEFITRVYSSGKKIALLREVTVFKVVATKQQNIYKTQSTEEQSDIFNRMISQPDFLYRETLAVVEQYMVNPKNAPRIMKSFEPDESIQPGAIIEQSRLYRGLDAKLTGFTPVNTSNTPLWLRKPTHSARNLLSKPLRRKLSRLFLKISQFFGNGL